MKIWLQSMAALLLFAGPALATEFDLAKPASSCLISESEIVDLSSSSEGTLDRVLAKVGDRVKKGQLVAVLENDLERLARDIAKARAERDVEARIKKRELAAAQEELTIKQKLLARKVAAKKVVYEAKTAADLAQLQLEQASHDREIARINLQQAEAALKRRSIYSPIDGIVTKVHRWAGEYVNAANPVMTIAAVDILRVETYLPMEAYPLIREGMPAIIIPQAPIGGEYETSVETRAPVIDAASGLFQVDLNLNNSKGEIPAGIRCSIRFPKP
ncbi:MAG: efflux RND transporter periplasmic adaptor subunit [Cohaesibacter sp.]|jgi:RND family efflux transporter MFP subunit|nr:efflux RND transporter periplasmic adaptor subunit [Cohaesibacter sp.]